MPAGIPAVRLLGAGSLLLMAALAPATVSAQTDKWQRQTADALRRAGPLLADQGYAAAVPSRFGMLSTDDSEQLTIPMAAGRSYAIIAVCDVDCGNLDLVLSRSSRQEVASDRDGGNAPIVKVTTTLAGDYGLKVIMTACRLGPCRYGIAVYSRTAPPLR